MLNNLILFLAFILPIMRRIIFALFCFCQLGCQPDITYAPYNNYLQGVQSAHQNNKPIFLHFTCWGCIGYNSFEHHIITNKAVKRLLNQDFISIDLYTDDKTSLDQKTLQQFIQTINFDSLAQQQILKFKTLGAVNTAIERTLFKKSTQPLYVLLSPNGNLLIPPFGYFGKDPQVLIQNLEKAKKNLHQSSMR